MGRAVVSPASKFAVLPQLRQVFAKMEVNIPLVASKARLELSVGISAPQPPGAYESGRAPQSTRLFVQRERVIRGRFTPAAFFMPGLDQRGGLANIAFRLTRG